MARRCFDSPTLADYYPLEPMPRHRYLRRLGRLALLCPILLLAPSAAFSYKHRSGLAESRRSARHEVEALEEQWREAQITNDLPRIDHLLADDFVGISMTGQANTKAQQLERFRSRRLSLTRIDLSDRKIKILGPTVAIVTSAAEVEGTNEGEPIRGMFRYTRVYQRLASGVWVTTNFEATHVPMGRRP